MGTTIGEVNINLRMSLAAFKQDTRQGTQEASRATKQMADEMGAQSREAKAALALIGEEIGVSIPRHLRSFVTQLPGVSTALNAAFTSVAVIALLGVIVELGKKIAEVGEASAKSAEEWKKFNEQVDAMVNKADPLVGQLGTIGDKLGELSKKEADSSTIWKALGPILHDVGEEVIKLHPQFYLLSQLFHKGDKDLQAFSASISSFYDDLKQIEKLDGPEAALAAVTAKLNELYQSADKSNPLLQQTIHTLEDTQRLITNEVDDRFQKGLQKAAEEAKKAIDAEWESYKELQKIVKQSAVQNTADRFQTEQDLKRTGVFTETAPSIQGKQDLTKFLPFADTKALPIYIGQNRELVKIQTDQNEAVKQAAEIYTRTRTATESYQQEVAILDELLKQGKIDQDTYNRAIVEAKNRYDVVAKGLKDLGQDIGDTLKQAALFGRSWSDAFKSIGIELAQLILKMTLFKNIANSPGGSKGGGFLSSLVGGLIGFRAAGGPVYQGQGYIVGENGPEYFSPETSGYIHAKMSGSMSSQPIVEHNEFHFHGVTDADSFRKSKAQIAAEMAGVLSRHSRRNG